MKKTIQKLAVKIFSLLFILSVAGVIFSACSNGTQQSTSYFMVSYISRVGQAPKPLKVKDGTVLSFEQLPELICTNYTFGGWYIDDQKILPGKYSVTNNTVLSALWTGTECTVTFTHSDNISGNTFTNVYNIGDQIVLPDNPYGEKTGLEFMGWLNGSVYYREGEDFTVQSDSVFTAVYAEEGTHTISYYNVIDDTFYNGTDFDGIEYLIGSENPSTFTESQSIFISDLKKIGYTFEGWYSSVDCLSTNKAKTFWRAGEVQQNVALYAKWSMETYSIVFDGNSGSLINAADEQESFTLRFDEEITLPLCKYELSGYDFVGWTLDAENFENEFDEKVKISVEALAPFANGKTITLYAHWRDGILPARPTDFSVLGTNKTSVTLSWIPANTKDLAFTRLSYRKTTETINSFVDFLAEDNEFDQSGNLLHSTYTVTNLEQGKLYQFTISSYDVAGNSSINQDDSTVLAVPRSNQVFVPELSLNQSSSSPLVVTWDAPSVQEYPYIEKIALYVNGTLKETYTGQNSEGECYTRTQATVDIEPLELYKIKLKVDEMTDDSGRTNASESELYTYFSEPDFNAELSPVTINNEEKVCWKYLTELGFSLERPTQLPEGFTDDSYTLYAECIPLDSEGNPDERMKTMGKLVFDNTRNLYIRSNLEFATDYKVQILAGVTKDFDGVSYTSYSRLKAETINLCSTVKVRGSEVGYFCYSSTAIYSEYQKSGTPIGIVTKVNNFNEPVTIISITDLYDGTKIAAVTGLNEASAKVKGFIAGGFIWNVPTKEEIDNIFDPQIKQKVFEALEIAGGELFAASTTNQVGLTNGRYITSTESTPGSVWVYDIDQTNCGTATSVSAQSSGVTFVVRPVVRF